MPFDRLHVTRTVYGVILNTRPQLDALGPLLDAPPYGKPPQAPVLYIKPPNTWLPGGGEVAVPSGVEALEMGAALAVVIGRTATRVSEAEALDHVLGYAPAIDVCIPHDSLHRPAIRQRCRDGFLPIGAVTPKSAVDGLNALDIVLHVNGKPASRYSTADLVRPVARLIADVTDFMTLFAGDVLLAGLPPDGPQASLGDLAEARIEGVGAVSCVLAPEALA
jgi:5-oxopent-3-ene-1,2,5-tricarboxylate decarboxylase/2-hydroxyhepta-2,4-diene-1,7-dioate isomerase